MTDKDKRRRRKRSKSLEAVRGGDWGQWAMFIVAETKRFAMELEKNDEMMYNVQTSLSELRVSLGELNVFRQRLHTLESGCESNNKSIDDLKEFKTRAMTASGVAWALVLVAVTVVGIVLGITK